MSDEYTEVTNESWGGRIMSSIKGVVLGLLFFLISFPVLWLNEGRAVKEAKKLKEGLSVVVHVEADTSESVNDGKLIHITGKADTKDLVSDHTFNLSVNALRLSRHVQMYQWEENVTTTTKKKLGGGETTTKKYTYQKTWSSTIIPSHEFKKPEKHQNPNSIPYKSIDFTAKTINVGAFRLSHNLINKLDRSEIFNINQEAMAKVNEAVGENLGWKLVDGALYRGDVNNPKLGDLRIGFSVLYPTIVSIIAEQRGTDLVAYKTSYGPVEMLSFDNRTAQEMFEEAMAANAMLTWIFRLLGLILMIAGISLILKPLATLLAVVPFFENLIGAGIFVFALLISIVLAFITIAIAWIFYRPLVGIALLVGAIIAFFGLKKIGTSKHKEENANKENNSDKKE